MYRIKFIQLVSYIFVFNLIAYSQSDITKIYSRLHQINKTTQVQILNSKDLLIVVLQLQLKVKVQVFGIMLLEEKNLSYLQNIFQRFL